MSTIEVTVKVSKLTLKLISNYFEKFGDKADEILDHIFICKSEDGFQKLIIGRTGVLMVRQYCIDNKISYKSEIEKLKAAIFGFY